MSQGFRNAGGSMIKDISYSAYIIPVRAGRVAVLKYGENGYGPIGGRLDAGEDFDAAFINGKWVHEYIVEKMLEK